MKYQSCTSTSNLLPGCLMGDAYIFQMNSGPTVLPSGSRYNGCQTIQCFNGINHRLHSLWLIITTNQWQWENLSQETDGVLRVWAVPREDEADFRCAEEQKWGATCEVGRQTSGITVSKRPDIPQSPLFCGAFNLHLQQGVLNTSITTYQPITEGVRMDHVTFKKIHVIPSLYTGRPVRRHLTFPDT